MTEYLKPKFSVSLAGREYADGWERIFGGRSSADSTDVDRAESDLAEVRSELPLALPSCGQLAAWLEEYARGSLFSPEEAATLYLAGMLLEGVK